MVDGDVNDDGDGDDYGTWSGVCGASNGLVAV